MSRPVGELIRLAMVYAEQDRRSFAEANGSNQVAAEANELADAFRAYRMKRWGRTTMEAQLDSATLVPIDELRRRASQETRPALSIKDEVAECPLVGCPIMGPHEHAVGGPCENR